MNYFMFIINNFEIGSVSLKAERIFEILINRKSWIFNRNTPNLKKMHKGDRVLVYMAGKERRKYVGSFTIGGEIKELDISTEDKDEKVLFNMYELIVPIKDINIYNEPVFIKDVKNSLNFISDKKNYGLFLRQSTKVISPEDYNTIISKVPIVT